MDLFLSTYKVGKPTEQEAYLKAMEKYGYDDDFDYFLAMDESKVFQMCEKCGIQKTVHIDKVLAGWTAEKKRVCVTEEISDGPAPSGTLSSSTSSKIPEVVQELLVPTPNNKMQESFNKTVLDVYHKSFHLFPDEWKFQKYVLGQRQMRYDIDCLITSISKRLEDASSSKDGNWINVNYFESGFVTEKNISRARNAISFLEKEMGKVNKEIDNTRSRRCHISKELQAWQVSEVQFYDAASTRLKEVINNLKVKKDEIESKVKVAERCVNEKNARESEEARKKRNREASQRKEDRVKKERAKSQALKVLGMLKFENVAEISLEGLKVTRDQVELKECHLQELRHRKHSQGITYLIENGILSEFPELHDALKDRLRVLEESLYLKQARTTKTAKSTKQKPLFPFKPIVKVSGGEADSSKKKLKQMSLVSLIQQKKKIEKDNGDEEPTKGVMRWFESRNAKRKLKANLPNDQEEKRKRDDESDELENEKYEERETEMLRDDVGKKLERMLKEFEETEDKERESNLEKMMGVALPKASLRDRLLGELKSLIDKPLVIRSALEVDPIGASLLPGDVADGKLGHPRKCSGGGNCLFNAVSILLCGDQHLSHLLREQASNVMMKTPTIISFHPYVGLAADRLKINEDQVFLHLFAMSTQDKVLDGDREQCVVEEGKRIADSGEYGSLSVLIALAEVTKRRIMSLYPDVSYKFRPLFHGLITPSEVNNEAETMHILFSRDNEDVGAKWFTPNHFVPIIPN